jgi:hypothetical protein
MLLIKIALKSGVQLFSSVGRKCDAMRGRTDKSSSLGMPMSPQEILKRYKRQSLGMPKTSPSSSTKASGHSSLPFIMLHMHCGILGASFAFTFSISLFYFFNKLAWTPSFLFLRGDTRSIFIAKKNTQFSLLVILRVFTFCGYCLYLFVSPLQSFLDS